MTLLRTAAIAAAVVAGSTVAASAAPLYATGAQIVQDGPRGTANDRANLANALGSELGSFFELGYGAVVDFTFAMNFTGPGSVVEVSFGNPASNPEFVQVQAGLGGVFQDVATLSNAESQLPDGGVFQLAGTFDTLRLIDQTPVTRSTGGFDVDRVSVAAIPVPAAGATLLGALGALVLFRRRKG